MMTVQKAFDLAFQHHQAGRLAEAEALYRQILDVQPDHADAVHYLGVLAHQVGRHKLAVQMIRRAIALQPHHPAAHSNLGVALGELGLRDEAMASYRRAIELQPDYAEAHNNLGNVLRDRGQLDEAIAAYRQAIELRPDFADAHMKLGITFRERGRYEEAIAAFHRALQLHPNLAAVHCHLGIALHEHGQLDQAIVAYRRALELEPGFAEAHNNLGNALKDHGEMDAAIRAYRRSLQLEPERALMHSNLIFALHLDPISDGRAIAEEQRRWNQRFGGPLQRFIRPHLNDRHPDRRLRIGYVSPDFCDHVVGRNVLPLFRRHDHRDFEIACYSGVLRPDALTAEFRQRAELWRNTVGLADETLAELIRQDAVDILVDLTLHSAGNRLPVFARRPAPVQVSFAGYPESTGVEAIGYRISDRLLESDTNLRPAEQLFLINSFWCYDPCGMEIAVNESPAKNNGHVTFGSLNTFSKINEPLLKLWARVLGRVSGSHLAMLCPEGNHRQRALRIFQQEGIEAERVKFFPRAAHRDYLALYQRLDLVLDTFPYNGHTTSLDALWMGVPVVSLRGETRVSRGGLSILSNLGLPELVAHSEDEYVEIATRLAGDWPRLAELRQTLRARMETSVLMDRPNFAQNIETAYRTMWRQWCAETASC